MPCLTRAAHPAIYGDRGLARLTRSKPREYRETLQSFPDAPLDP